MRVSRTCRSSCPRSRRPFSRESGFTIVEMMVALSILAIALFSLAYTATIGFTYSARARQKQDATSIANQAIEQIKALAFANLEAGMKTADLAGDSAITTCGADKCYGGMTIVQSTNPPVSPLNPHIVTDSTTKVGVTQYTRKAYLTYTDASRSQVRITVVLSWIDGGVTKSVTELSEVALTTSCPAGDLHPFAGPCQTQVGATAEAPSLTIEIDPVDTNGNGTIDAGEGFTGLGTSSQILAIAPGLSATLSTEQTADVAVSAKSDGFTATGQTDCGNVLSSAEAQTTGASYAFAPTTANDTICPTDSSTPLANIKVPAGTTSQNQLVLQKTAAASPSTGSVVATISASGSDSPSCNSQTDSTPCGYATMNSGATSWTLWQASGYSAGSLGTTANCPLVQVTPAASGSTAYVKRAPVTSSVDKSTATANQILPTVAIGCVPTGFTSSLWSSRTAWDAQSAVPSAAQRKDSGGTLRGFMLEIYGATQQASVESGTGTTTSTPSRAGTIYYWNGSGYSSGTVPAYNAAATFSGLASADTGCQSIAGGKNEVVLSPVDAGTILGSTVAAQTSISYTAMISTIKGTSPVAASSKIFVPPSFPAVRVQVFGANSGGCPSNSQLADFAVSVNYPATSVSSSYSVPAG